MSLGNSTVDMSARFVFRNLAEIKRDLEKWDSKRRPVAETAIRVELYRLRGLMKADLRKGQIAGKEFAPLRVVSRGSRFNKKPLSGLSLAVRYNVQKEGDKTHMSIGFEGPQSSKAWRRIAHKVQEGYEIDPNIHMFGSTLRKMWTRVGGDYKKTEDARHAGGEERFSKFYFLRKTTQKLKLPARPIVEPFWKHHETTAEKNILSNFERKMRGERI